MPRCCSPRCRSTPSDLVLDVGNVRLTSPSWNAGAMPTPLACAAVALEQLPYTSRPRPRSGGTSEAVRCSERTYITIQIGIIDRAAIAHIGIWRGACTRDDRRVRLGRGARPRQPPVRAPGRWCAAAAGVAARWWLEQMPPRQPRCRLRCSPPASADRRRPNRGRRERSRDLLRRCPGSQSRGPHDRATRSAIAEIMDT